MSEFAFSHGRVSKGIWSAFWASLKFVIIPLALLMMLDFALMEIASGLADADPGLGAISRDLNTMMVRASILGIPLVILAYFRGFYPRGSYSRLVFGLLLVAGAMTWLWWVTFGGHLEVVLSDVGMELDTSGILALIILAVGLRALIYLAECKDYRQDFLNPPEENDGTGLVTPIETAQTPSDEGAEEDVEDSVEENAPDEDLGASDI